MAMSHFYWSSITISGTITDNHHISVAQQLVVPPMPPMPTQLRMARIPCGSFPLSASPSFSEWNSSCRDGTVHVRGRVAAQHWISRQSSQCLRGMGQQGMAGAIPLGPQTSKHRYGMLWSIHMHSDVVEGFNLTTKAEPLCQLFDICSISSASKVPLPLLPLSWQWLETHPSCPSGHFWPQFWPESYHLPCICNSLELESVILHCICYIWQCLPSILHGICVVLALQPLICIVFATFWYFDRSCAFLESLGFHFGFH